MKEAHHDGTLARRSIEQVLPGRAIQVFLLTISLPLPILTLLPMAVRGVSRLRVVVVALLAFLNLSL